MLEHSYLLPLSNPLTLTLFFLIIIFIKKKEKKKKQASKGNDVVPLTWLTSKQPQTPILIPSRIETKPNHYHLPPPLPFFSFFFFCWVIVYAGVGA